jgi:histidyl-tRNA synthetase
MPLSTQPYRGARDFYPEDKRIQKYMFGVWRKSVESFGYEEYDAPILEPLSIYLAKTGQEIVNEQTYVFKDRGDREVVIRPEMTPTVSRMVAAKRQELVYPVRWYSIPNLWRYERPQRGRLREHWQLNVDIFGVESIEAEQEIILIVDSIFKNFGANNSMFEIRLNNRKLVNQVLNEYLGLPEEIALQVSKLIDRIEKMDKDEFLSKLDQLLDDKQRANSANQKLLKVLEAKTVDDLPDELKKVDSFVELKQLIKNLNDIGLSHVRYDPALMRGFDYYTDTVFEVFDLDPNNNRSMMGGGRYDGLVGLFGVEPVPTVGFGWGDVTLLNFLETHNLLPKLNPETDLYVAVVGDDYQQIQSSLQELRSAGINVYVDLSGKKIGDQLKNANKRGVQNLLIVGEQELRSGKFKLKDMASSQEDELTIKELINRFKKDK